MGLLVTGFRGTSAEVLVKKANDKLLILPNDKVVDSQLLSEEIGLGKYDFIVSFGQKPNIKDKVYIETTARHGDRFTCTEFEYGCLKAELESENITVRISDNAGTSFCNELYWNGLNYISDKGLEAKMIFLHIPFLQNITASDSFFEGILGALKKYNLRQACRSGRR